LIFHSNNLTSLINSVNEELCIIENWFQTNKLSLNVKKTKFMIFHKPRKKLNHDHIAIKISNYKIEEVNEFKFLGAYIDSNLSWKIHTTKKANQILRVVGVLSRLKNLVPIKILKTIYNSLVLPHLSYAIICWGNSTGKEIKRLHILQKRAIRTISRSKYNSHTSKLFKQMNLLKLDDIFHVACAKFYYSIKTNLVSHYFQQLLPRNTDIHNYYTRNNEDLHIFNANTNLQNQLVNVKISKVWNSLPISLKAMNLSNKCFSYKVKNFYLSQYPTECFIPNCYICGNIS